MSFTNQSGDLAQFSEVVPEAARVQGLTRSSILTQRRRVKLPAQTGPTSAPSSQIQFLIADQGGLVDPRSICLNYNILTTTAAVPDDGHVFTNVQVLLNGQPLDNIQSAMKLTNIEMTMGASKTYYETAGSFQGFELLNDNLNTATTPAGSYGQVSANVTDIAARTSRAADNMFGGITGEQRSIPLGLMSGVGRMKSYIPIALLGEIALVLQTGSAGECLFNPTSNVTGTYTLSQISLEYDVVIPRPEYMMLLQKIANDPSDAGLNLPFESSIVQAGAAISAGSTALTETNIVVSRATNHLLRSSVVQVPTALVQSLNYPSQSCFSHAGIYSAQWRIGSMYYPSLPAQGDAALFNCAMEAYGSVAQENGTVTNRVLWANSTNGATAGTAAVYETASLPTGGTVRFAYADKCVPSYGFRTVKGQSVDLDIDGVSLAGASGSQCIVTVVSAPAIGYTPFVSLVALRFIQAQSGGVRVAGA
jgi:hypothetical protein